MAHQLPQLPYSVSALEPHIDARTMEIHHDKHHATYITKLNAALEGHPALQDLPVEQLIADLAKIPEAIRGAVRNNGGGHANHTLFWELMAPPSASSGQGGAGGEPTGPLADAITKTFGTFTAFKQQLGDAAVNRFGSGWAWLVFDKGQLAVLSTANQDSPLMEGKIPLLGLDVWEHAYYLHYQNRRPDYVAAWWSVVNWKKVAELYQKAKG